MEICTAYMQIWVLQSKYTDMLIYDIDNVQMSSVESVY